MYNLTLLSFASAARPKKDIKMIIIAVITNSDTVKLPSHQCKKKLSTLVLPVSKSSCIIRFFTVNPPVSFFIKNGSQQNNAC
jgi:hypothetical protein